MTIPESESTARGGIERDDGRLGPTCGACSDRNFEDPPQRVGTFATDEHTESASNGFRQLAARIDSAILFRIRGTIWSTTAV